MKIGEENESFTVLANSELHRAVLAARKAGRRHGGKLVSCTMAFELGARILLGLEENEEDILKQDILEIKTQKAALEQKERMRLEQLRMMEASRAAKLSEASYQNNNVQKLADKIIEVWDSVILYKRSGIIESLVDIDRTRLTRPKLEAIFPKRYVEKPSIDEAVKIALDLLEGDSVGA
jgi:hypothetical protein